MSTQGSERYSESEGITLEVKRQLFHLLLIALWSIPIIFFPLGFTLLLFLVVLILNLLVVLRVDPFQRVFSILILHLERKVNIRKPGIQALYANLGIFLSYVLFGKAALIGVVVLSVGDSVSTLMGKIFGTHRIFFNIAKTWEGTMFFFLATFLTLLFFLSLEEALLVAIFGALLEASDIKFDDNFTIPLFSTALSYLV